MKWQGKAVSEGLAMAQIHLFTPKLPEISRQPAADAEAEVAKLEATLAAAGRSCAGSMRPQRRRWASRRRRSSTPT